MIYDRQKKIAELLYFNKYVGMYLCNYLVYLGNNKKCKQYFLLLNHTNICTHLYFYKKKAGKIVNIG